jgi:hypothetical protein
MEKGFFHPDRGYWQTLTDPSDSIRAEYPDGTVEVELQPSQLHKMVDGQWVLPTQAELDAAEAASVRIKRDALLARVVDPIATNALRWASLTEDQRQAWAAYRQALLDITKQAGFPHNVTWPSKPE